MCSKGHIEIQVVHILKVIQVMQVLYYVTFKVCVTVTERTGATGMIRNRYFVWRSVKSS